MGSCWLRDSWKMTMDYGDLDRVVSTLTTTLQPTLMQLMKYTPSGLALANVFVLISQDYWHLPVACRNRPSGILLILSVTKVKLYNANL